MARKELSNNVNKTENNVNQIELGNDREANGNVPGKGRRLGEQKNADSSPMLTEDSNAPGDDRFKVLDSKQITSQSELER